MIEKIDLYGLKGFDEGGQTSSNIILLSLQNEYRILIMTDLFGIGLNCRFDKESINYFFDGKYITSKDQIVHRKSYHLKDKM